MLPERRPEDSSGSTSLLCITFCIGVHFLSTKCLFSQMSSCHYGVLLDFVQIQLFDFGVAISTWTGMVLEICS